MFFVALVVTLLAHTFYRFRMGEKLLQYIQLTAAAHIQRQLQRFTRIFRRRTIFGWIELYLRLLLLSLLVMHYCWLLLPLLFPFFIKPHRFCLKLSNEPGFSICSRKKQKKKTHTLACVYPFMAHTPPKMDLKIKTRRKKCHLAREHSVRWQIVHHINHITSHHNFFLYFQHWHILSDPVRNFCRQTVIERGKDWEQKVEEEGRGDKRQTDMEME